MTTEAELREEIVDWQIYAIFGLFITGFEILAMIA